MNIVSHRSAETLPRYRNKFRSDRSAFARIPFSFAAVTILLLSTILTGELFEAENLKRDKQLEQRMAMLEHAALEESQQLEALAYYSLQAVLANVTSIDDLESQGLNRKLQTECERSFSDYYPKTTEGYTVELERHYIMAIEDYCEVQTDPSPTYMSVDLAVPVYLKLMGTIYFTVSLNDASGLKSRKILNFDRAVPSPLPLMLNSLNIFKAQADGSYSDTARLTRYILTTTVQLRALAGSGISEQSKSLLLTEADVEDAVNLAVILEQARIFGSYDPLAADSLGITELLQTYIKTGEIDGADLTFILKDMQHEKIQLGRLLAESIQAYTDEFVYSLLRLFWPDTPPDAVLQEPQLDWSALKAKGESYAKQKLEEWLGKFKSWLILPPYIFAQSGSAVIPTIYQHATSVDCVSKFPATLPVSGNYDLFSFPGKAYCYFYAGGIHFDELEWPPAKISIDPVDLILGDAYNSKFLPEPFEISFLTNFDLPTCIKYHLVHESFIGKYSSEDSKTPYFDSLRYILETLRTGITIRDNGQPLKHTSKKFGLVDMMAEDAEIEIDRELGSVTWKDVYNADITHGSGQPVLTGGTAALLEGPVESAIHAFRRLARDQELSAVSPYSSTWFSSGLLKKNEQSGGLYNLFVDTVDLFYELYWTLQQSALASFGKYDGNWAWKFPDTHYAPVETVQVKSKIDDYFNFNNDALKITYNSVWSIVLMHLIPIKKFFHADWKNVGKFELAGPPIPELAWLWYGQYKYPGDLVASNRHLWSDVRKRVKIATDNTFRSLFGISAQADAGLAFLDVFTDTRSYKVAFHEFLWLNVGREVLNPRNMEPESVTEMLVKPSCGWLETMLCQNLPEALLNYIEYQNIVHPTAVDSKEDLCFNKKFNTVTSTESYQYVEHIGVAQNPSYLRANRDMKITISDPILEPRFVSVQETQSDLCDVPFVTSWCISAAGSVNIMLESGNYCIYANNGFVPLRLYEEVPFSYELSIPVFTGWPLANPIYPMTQTALAHSKISSEPGRQLSSKITNLLESQQALESEILNKFNCAVTLIEEHPLGPIHERALNLNKPDALYNSLEFLCEQPCSVKIADLSQKFLKIERSFLVAYNKNLNIMHQGASRNYCWDSPRMSQTTLPVQSGTSSYIIEYIFYGMGCEITLIYNTNELTLTINAEDPQACSEEGVLIEVNTPVFQIRTTHNERPCIPTAGTDVFCILREPVGITGAEPMHLDLGLEIEPIDVELKDLDEFIQIHQRRYYCEKVSETVEYYSNLIHQLERSLADKSDMLSPDIVINFFFSWPAKNGYQKSVTISITDVYSINALKSYLEVLRSTLSDIIHYLGGANGGAALALPPTLFTELAVQGLDPTKITVLFTESDRQHTITKTKSATLDRFIGPRGIFNDHNAKSTESVYVKPGNGYASWYGLVYRSQP